MVGWVATGGFLKGLGPGLQDLMLAPGGGRGLAFG